MAVGPNSDLASTFDQYVVAAIVIEIADSAVVPTRVLHAHVDPGRDLTVGHVPDHGVAIVITPQGITVTVAIEVARTRHGPIARHLEERRLARDGRAIHR